MSDVLLEARRLSRDFPSGGGKTIHAVSEVSLQIREGETLGLVGESGCGKSTLGRLLIRALAPTSGEVLYRGRSLTAMPEKAFRPLRRRMQLVFQDPWASLDPRMTVRDLIAEPLETWRICGGKAETTKRVAELMRAVGLPEEFLYRYPHQFSGGQRQRIGIARAIAAEPEFIVCDEPVSALDVSVQNQILNLLKGLRAERKLTYLFISHNLSVVRYLSDRVCVMYLGNVCEPARRRRYTGIRGTPIPVSCWTRCRFRIPDAAGRRFPCCGAIRPARRIRRRAAPFIPAAPGRRNAAPGKSRPCGPTGRCVWPA